MSPERSWINGPGARQQIMAVGKVILPEPPPLLGGLSAVSGICHLFSVLGTSLLPFFTMTTEKIKYNEGDA